MNNLRNRVTLIGNVGRDPEMKEFENGNKCVRMSLATSENYKDAKGNWVNQTQWHTLVAWGPVAERASKLLKKGSEVAVEGKLVHRQYTGKDGDKRNISEVVVRELMMVGKKKED